MSILEDLTSKDASRIWSGSCAIRTLRDRAELLSLAAHLDQIRDSTKDIALGGALRPNSSHLNFAIRKLEFVKDTNECLCALYQMDDLYSPEKEQEAGNIRITGTTFTEGKLVDYYTCECVDCGAKFKVEEREYHYAWWNWKRA